MTGSFKTFALPFLLCAAFAFAQENSSSFRLGARAGLGISAIRGHKALYSTDFGSNAIRLKPAFSIGAGAASEIKINSLLSVAPELQYTLYRTNGEFSQKNNADFPDLNEAGANLHAFELPILVRFSFGSYYAEAGPQVGYSYYAKIYKNSELSKPEINAFAFGPSLGGGINLNGVLIGIRCHFGLLEYAKNTNGYPWATHASITHFFF